MVRLKAFAVAALVAATVVTPARAGVDLPGFVCRTAPAADRLTVCVKGVAQLVPAGSARGRFVGVCEAVVQGVVSATTVGCEVVTFAEVVRANAENVATPGVASTTYVSRDLALEPLYLCVAATYLATNGQVAHLPGTEWATYVCFTTPL